MQAVFGPFCFDLETLELTKFGVRLALEEKPARALACLIERRGSLVSRDELRSCLWDQSVNIDFNHGLNKALNKLRTVLSDDANQPQYLETLSRRGYRFIAEVEMIPGPAAPDTGKSANSLIEISDGSGYFASDQDSPVAVTDSPAGVWSKNVGIGRLLTSAANKPKWHKTVLVGICAVISVSIAIGVGFLKWNRGDQPRSLRAVIKLPSNLQLMTASENLGLAISPDETQMVFSAVGPDGIPGLWLRRLDTLTPEPIAGTERGSFPFWSPDGKNLGFFTELQLKRVNLADHSVTTLCAAEAPRGGSWSSNGVILFSSDTRGPIYKISANGGTPVPVTTLDESRFTTHRWPVFLEDGTHFLFLAANHVAGGAPGSIYLASLAGGEPKLLGEADSNVIPVASSLLFLSHGKLMSQRLSLESGSLQSQATIVAEAVQFDPGLWYGTFSATRSMVVYRARGAAGERQTISWFDKKGNKVSDVGRPGVYRGVSLSPDGKTIAVLCGDPEMNVCLIHGDGTITQITSGAIHGGLAWLTDSSAISYYTHEGRSTSSSIKPLDGVAPEHVLSSAKNPLLILSWHPDKRHALVTRTSAAGYECLILDLATSKTKRYLGTDPGPTEWFRFSPDGHWVAYEKSAGGTDQIRIVSYPVPSAEYSIPLTPGLAPKWRGDGLELYFLGPGDTLYSVPVTRISKGLKIGAAQPLFRPPIFPFPWNRNSFDVAQDGTKFLINTVGGGDRSELVLATNWHRE